MNAIVKQVRPRTIGEVANKRDVVRERRRQETMVWVIYGGCRCHLFWCQRPTCACYTTP